MATYSVKAAATGRTGAGMRFAPHWVLWRALAEFCVPTICGGGWAPTVEEVAALAIFLKFIIEKLAKNRNKVLK